MNYLVRYDDFGEFYRSWVRSDSIEDFEGVDKYLVKSIKSLRSFGYEEFTRSDSFGYHAI